MKLTTEQIKFILDNGPMIFCTASKRGEPRATIIKTDSIYEDTIVIDDVQMGKSARNLKENHYAFILSFAPDHKRWLKISGTIEYHENGDLLAKRQADADPAYPPKAAIQFTISGIEDISDD